MNPFSLLGNLGNLMKLQQETQLLTKELAAKTYEGKAGGGMVSVTVNGAQQLLRCEIDPTLSADKDRELIEDLVVAAANAALDEAKRQSAEIIQKRLAEQLGGLDLKEMMGGLGGLLGK